MSQSDEHFRAWVESFTKELEAIGWRPTHHGAFAVIPNDGRVAGGPVGVFEAIPVEGQPGVVRCGRLLRSFL